MILKLQKLFINELVIRLIQNLNDKFLSYINKKISEKSSNITQDQSLPQNNTKMSIQQQFEKITSKQISEVISSGLAQIYSSKPSFPITYLANWLKQYDSNQKLKSQIIRNRQANQQTYDKIQKDKLEKQEILKNQTEAKEKIMNQKKQQFGKMVTQTKHLEDLLVQWLPDFVQSKHQFTGVYVGKLDFNKKKVEPGNFEIGAENDVENPKIITYIGASTSHTPLMKNNSLPNGKGISYEVFQQSPEQANQEGQQNSAPPKKKYIYVSNVLKQPKLHYFQYPKLGAYVCYPLKINSCLNTASLDKGIIDYKAYLKTKQQTQKQYQEKINEARTQSEEANKKIEDFQVVEEDPASHQQKKALQAQAQTSNQKLQQLLRNPPIVQEVKFDTVQKLYFMGCDTLGQDREIPQSQLQDLGHRVDLFVKKWQDKEKSMVLKDILNFLEQQPLLQNMQNQVQQHEKNLLNNFQAQIKQQYANRQKQGQYQFSIIKCQKTKQLLTNDQIFKNSMEVYLNYNVPKFTQLIQICLMLLRYQRAEINAEHSNQLNFRKMVTKQSFKNMLQALEKYQLRRQSSEDVASQYKINKLLQRLEKFEAEALAKYNGFLYLLHYLLKTICWTRILCRDAKKEIFQRKNKQKEDKDAQIQKWNVDIQKNLETAKAELDEEGQQNFKEQQWRKNYEQQNPRPEPLEAPVIKQFLDVE